MDMLNKYKFSSELIKLNNSSYHIEFFVTPLMEMSAKSILYDFSILEFCNFKDLPKDINLSTIKSFGVTLITKLNNKDIKTLDSQIRSSLTSEDYINDLETVINKSGIKCSSNELMEFVLTSSIYLNVVNELEWSKEYKDNYFKKIINSELNSIDTKNIDWLSCLVLTQYKANWSSVKKRYFEYLKNKK